MADAVAHHVRVGGTEEEKLLRTLFNLNLVNRAASTFYSRSHVDRFSGGRGQRTMFDMVANQLSALDLAKPDAT